MEKLIVVRHGSYSSKTGRLTSFGEKQIERLANFIKKTCSGNYWFACSGADRAEGCVRILRDALDHKKYFENWDELFDEKDYLILDKADKIHQRVNDIRDKADNLVLVSHFSVATGYPTYFMQKEFRDIKGIDNVPMGKAVLVDIVKKDYDIIPH